MLNNRTIIVISIGALLAVCMFLLGRNSVTVPDEVKPTDVSNYLKTIDSLKVDKKLLRDSMTKELINIQKLKTNFSDNNKKTRDEFKKVDKFTPTIFNSFDDSLLRAEGLR